MWLNLRYLVELERSTDSFMEFNCNWIIEKIKVANWLKLINGITIMLENLGY